MASARAGPSIGTVAMVLGTFPGGSLHVPRRFLPMHWASAALAPTARLDDANARNWNPPASFGSWRLRRIVAPESAVRRSLPAEAGRNATVRDRSPA